MFPDYIEVTIHVREEFRDLLMAQLSDDGFESFLQEDEVLLAFAKAGSIDTDIVKKNLKELYPNLDFSFEVKEIKGKNWNEEWEKNYSPVEVDNFCQIIPGFIDPKPGFMHTLKIEPKMSFGTGHHETTQLMIRWCATQDFNGKSVLDMGCGTGILGILAKKLGAERVDLVDIEEACVENTTENIALNGLRGLSMHLGGSEWVEKEAYDIIIANINRNVLIGEAVKFKEGLKKGGKIVLSGFFDFDEVLIAGRYKELGFRTEERAESGGWMLLSLKLSEA